MSSYKIIINTCTILLSSVLVLSCSDSADMQSQNSSGSDSVIVGLSGPTVALSSKDVSAEVGEIFTLDITMSDFPTSEGGGVTVHFDPSMLNVSNVAINAETWTFVNKIGEIDNNSGVISDILFSSFQGVSSNCVVASITFMAINSGNSAITLQSSLVNPFSSNGDKIAANFIDTNVQIIATSAN